MQKQIYSHPTQRLIKGNGREGDKKRGGEGDSKWSDLKCSDLKGNQMWTRWIGGRPNLRGRGHLERVKSLLPSVVERRGNAGASLGVRQLANGRAASGDEQESAQVIVRGLGREAVGRARVGNGLHGAAADDNRRHVLAGLNRERPRWEPHSGLKDEHTVGTARAGLGYCPI